MRTCSKVPPHGRLGDLECDNKCELSKFIDRDTIDIVTSFELYFVTHQKLAGDALLTSKFVVHIWHVHHHVGVSSS